MADDAKPRVDFIDGHGGFYVTLDGESTGCAVYGVTDAMLIGDVLVAKAYNGDGKWWRYDGERRWTQLGTKQPC